MAEDLPQHDNRIQLSSTIKDYWGLPAPEVHHVYHDMDRKALTFAASKICEILKAAGGVDIEQPKIHENIGGRYTWHLMGTTRMGLDPSNSVVNSDGRCHDVPNLFVVDGAVFPTSGGLNPTLTMQALSFRTADRIIALTKEGKL
jgi:choline dehydrogenase-like flavoprotein